jgi:hypothetical protein
VSSAILYVAIVAIWIGVLVPRWLHHDGAATGTGLRRLSRHFSGSRPAADPDPQAGHEPGGRAGFDPEGRPRYTSFVPPEPEQDAPASPSKLQVHHEEHVSSPASGNRESMAQLYEADASPAPVRSYGWSAEEAVRQENRPRKGATATPAAPLAGSGHHGPHGPAPYVPPARQAPSAPSAPAAPHVPAARRGESPADDDAGYEDDGYYRDDPDAAERHTRLVRSRRRILGLLVVLVIAGVGLTFAKLASWWIMVPPVVLLGGYLLLLREAAQADAETRVRREAERHEAAQDDAPAHDGVPTAAEPVPAAAAAHHETGPRAAVIDLSERAGDQLYDQYADAKLRAVGD